MNIWHTIVVKISNIVAVVLIFVGLSQPVIPPQTTIMDIQPSGQVISTTTPEQPAMPPSAPKVIVEIPAPSPAVQTAPTTTTATTTTATTTPIQEPTPAPPASQPIYVPIYIIQPAPALTPAPTVEPIKIEPIDMKSITIISPTSGKGLGRRYEAIPQECALTVATNAGNVEPLCSYDEANYVVLGLVVKNGADEVMKDTHVVITATNERQNKTINNTGSVTPIYINGVKIITHFYPITYYFMTPGEHVIIFKAIGMTESVTLQVAEATRP